MYAMGLSYDWQSFFTMLQRIRYKNGEIGVLTRNHWTVANWDQSNSWMVEDITEKIALGKTVPMKEETGKKRFFAKWNIGQDLEDETVETTYIPADVVPEILDKLQNADFVNVIRGQGTGIWCGHTGLIAIGADGTTNFLHSSPPAVREQPLIEYTNKSLESNIKKEKENKAIFLGYKFFRLRPDALERLREIDGPDAPKVTGPLGLLEKKKK
jgi:hypothetical protein